MHRAAQSLAVLASSFTILSLASAADNTRPLHNADAPSPSAPRLMIEGGTASAGPDVIYTNISAIQSYTAVGGIRAYSLANATCNIGSVNLNWTNNGSPGLAMNAYRLYDGRLEQIGMSWVKTAFSAITQNGCGGSCNGVGGNHLGINCMDVDNASWNGTQNTLMARSQINPFTGSFGAVDTSTGSSINKRLQIASIDLDSVLFSGAQYFVEGEYIATDDSAAGNASNNVSYRSVTVAGGSILTPTAMTLSQVPGINAWRDNGLGAGLPDTSVEIQNVDVPGEGRFIAACKAKENGNGTWRYEYAVFNQNSDRAGGSFTVPTANGAVITNAGFHDVDYHSGEIYDNTDWSIAVGSNSVTWSSPETFAQNPNSNALRWGTMYNFWFDANVAPAAGTLTLGLFKPGAPSDVTFTGPVPQPTTCSADIAPSANPDGVVNISDLTAIILAWGTNDVAADINHDGVVNISDLTLVILAWGSC